MSPRQHENKMFKILRQSSLGFGGAYVAAFCPPPELQAWFQVIGAIIGAIVGILTAINLSMLIADRVRSWRKSK